jgi:hypothetical protein
MLRKGSDGPLVRQRKKGWGTWLDRFELIAWSHSRIVLQVSVRFQAFRKEPLSGSTLERSYLRRKLTHEGKSTTPSRGRKFLKKPVRCNNAKAYALHCPPDTSLILITGISNNHQRISLQSIPRAHTSRNRPLRSYRRRTSSHRRMMTGQKAPCITHSSPVRAPFPGLMTSSDKSSL